MWRRTVTDKDAPSAKEPLSRRMLLSRPGLVVGTALLALVVGYATGSSGRRAAEREARELVQRLDSATLDLRLHRAESALATAVVEATYGSYEDARLSSGAFFDSLAVLSGVVPAERQNTLSGLLARRDDIQALLTRKEPIARDQLADVLTRYQTVLTGKRIRFEIPTGLPDSGGAT